MWRDFLRRAAMSVYVLLKRATAPGARKELLADAAKPERQLEAIGALGGKVMSHVATVGSFDTVMLVDLPEGSAILDVSIGCNTRGVDTVILRAFDAEAAAEALERTATLLSPESAGGGVATP